MGRANFNHAVWDTARQTGVTGLMPQDEITRGGRLYDELHIATDSDDATWTAINNARRYTFQDSDPSHLTPVQVAEEIELLKTVRMNHFNHGIAMNHIPFQFPGFPAGIGDADMKLLPHSPDPQTLKALASARNLTDERLKAAGYLPRKMTPTDGLLSIQRPKEK
jgi:hypothetical protein